MTQSTFGMGIYSDQESNADINVKDYNLYLDDIIITKGRLPENDYEVIVNKAYRRRNEIK